MFTFTPNILLNFALANPGTLGTSLQAIFNLLTHRHILSRTHVHYLIIEASPRTMAAPQQFKQA